MTFNHPLSCWLVDACSCFGTADILELIEVRSFGIWTPLDQIVGGLMLGRPKSYGEQTHTGGFRADSVPLWMCKGGSGGTRGHSCIPAWAGPRYKLPDRLVATVAGK